MHIYRFIYLALFINAFRFNFFIGILIWFCHFSTRDRFDTIPYDSVINAPHESMWRKRGLFLLFLFLFESWIRKKNADKNAEEITAGTFDFKGTVCMYSFISRHAHKHRHTHWQIHTSLSAD